MPDETPRITDERLAEIEARAGVATEGPWAVVPDGSGDFYRNDGDCFDIDSRDGSTVVYGGPVEDGGPHVGAVRDEADAVFIAHARTDVPDLLAEVRRLRGLVADLETRIERARKLCDENDGGLNQAHLVQLIEYIRVALAAGSGDGREAPAEER